MSLPEFADVERAAARLAGHAVETPLLNFPVLDEAAGGRILVKPESLQRTGSFKFRGAYNCISQIPEDRRAAGVVACSSGNHAQGVAAAAGLLGLKATIVMPADAPEVKLRRTRELGAEIVTYERGSGDRDVIAAEIVERTGARMVHPFEDPDVIAGQGTVGLEIARQARARSTELDAAITCAGGGGLTAGIVLALGELMADCAVYTCEPEGFDDHARSFASGTRQTNERRGGSICDALLVESPGENTFAINHSRIAGGLVVSDEEALAAVGFAAKELKLVVEPGGAVALAAVLTGKLDVAGKTTAIVLSGGNIDPQLLVKAVAAG